MNWKFSIIGLTTTADFELKKVPLEVTLTWVEYHIFNIQSPYDDIHFI